MNRIRKLLESTASGRRRLKEAEGRSIAYRNGYVSALYDIHTEVLNMPPTLGPGIHGIGTVLLAQDRVLKAIENLDTGSRNKTNISTYDPLCPTQNTNDMPGSCFCDLIARVREDEATKREADGPWFRSVVHECCERVQTERTAAIEPLASGGLITAEQAKCIGRYGQYGCVIDGGER